MRKTIIVLLLALYLSVQVQAAAGDFAGNCANLAACTGGKAGANSICDTTCKCKENFYGNLFASSNQCAACPANTQTAANNSLKLCACKSGFSTTASGTPIGSTTSADATHKPCKCTDANKYDKAGTCTECFANSAPNTAKTACICTAPDSYDKSGVCTACGAEATRSSADATKCVCRDTKTKANGFYLDSANACVACYDNSEPNDDRNACTCKSGFTANTAKSACAASATTSADMLKPFLAVFAVIFTLLLA